MNVSVVGTWHLGSVTAACLAAAGHSVVAFDPDADAVAALRDGKAPIAEPGLNELIAAGLESGNLRFADALQDLPAADIWWITYDTPVDDDDRADVAWTTDQIRRLFPHLNTESTVLISSQLPVGTTRDLESSFSREAGGRDVGFAVSPENLRLGKAIDVFRNPDRVVVGVRRAADRERIARVLAPITDRIEWMGVESAEMTKHAINSFLALSVAFINEIAALCEVTGADAREVERGLKTESRIGPRAYLGPGSAFAGGTLARDVVFLSSLSDDRAVPARLLHAIKASNDEHRLWARRTLARELGSLDGRTVALWGLTYKPGTDTLRRSRALELAAWLVEEGAQVRAFDPSLKELPSDLTGIVLAPDPLAAVRGADALVVETEWPDFRAVDLASLEVMKRPLIIDANRFLGSQAAGVPGIRYVSVGRSL